MHPVQQWLTSNKQDFNEGAELFAQYSKNKILAGLFTKCKRPDFHAKKLQYEMKKLWEKELVFQEKPISPEKQQKSIAIVNAITKMAEEMVTSLNESPQPISEKEQKEFESVWDIPWSELPEPIKDLINRRKDTKRKADFYSNANLEQYPPKERSEHAENVLKWDAELKEMDAQLEQWRTNRIIPTENSGKVEIDPNDKAKLISERNKLRTYVSKYKGKPGKEAKYQEYLEKKEAIDKLLGDAV